MADVLLDHDLVIPTGLRAVQRLHYRRTTLVLPEVPARITCDAGLEYVSAAGRAVGPQDHLIVEVKSPTGRNPATDSLSRLGIRPVQFSKYCIGAALLNGRNASRWQPVVRRYFGLCQS
ncbi:VTC domain-containing protein [Microlunatus elymi]|uniref:VTC domain-containing protein n=1 Tax=Microlunatus elymi TaxID=2596828 RepID=A0A516PXR5_9ACTN|nr:VTC domain-containing protein [Microlunatus elymi]